MEDVEIKLTPEQIEEQKKIARNASWINDIFQQNNLSVEDKQEIFRRLPDFIKEQELRKEDAEKSCDCQRQRGTSVGSEEGTQIRWGFKCREVQKCIV